ncbi:hypothetical protein Tco_1413359, partial [Tanacetum coccineum]
MLDTHQFPYTVDMFRDTHHLPMETPENLFVALANIHTIEAFMNRVGYQGVVDKLFHAVLNQTHVDYATLIWWDFMNNVFQKKEAIKYPRFIKLIVADLMKKFPNIPKRLEEDCHSNKDDVLLVSVYTMGNVLVQGMLIPDAFLTTEIRETNDFKEYETVFMKVDVPMNQPQPVVSTQGTNRNTPRAPRSPTVYASPPETKKRKQITGESSSLRKSLKVTIKQMEILDEEKDDVDFEDRLEPGSHKENPKVFDDDDDNAREKKDDTIDRADDIALWEALRHDDAPPKGEKRVKRSKESKRSKFAKGSSSKHLRKDSTTYVSKQQSQQQEWDAWEEENVIDEDEVIPADVTPKLIVESQNVDKRVPTVFDHARIEATLIDSLSNLSRNAKEYAYHLEQSTSFMENQIVWESRQQDI